MSSVLPIQISLCRANIQDSFILNISKLQTLSKSETKHYKKDTIMLSLYFAKVKNKIKKNDIFHMGTIFF